MVYRDRRRRRDRNERERNPDLRARRDEPRARREGQRNREPDRRVTTGVADRIAGNQRDRRDIKRWKILQPMWREDSRRHSLKGYGLTKCRRFRREAGTEWRRDGDFDPLA